MRTMGAQGMVASPHYLATGAGLNILRQGGSAVDAAIAANAVLAVVLPYLCGMGGDLFALVYTAADRRLQGLNGSGRAPREATPERIRDLSGSASMPQRGPHAVTVPGCVEAWGQLHGRYGRLPLSQVLADAIYYAEEGFPVTANFARALTVSEPILHPETPAKETFWPGGQPPTEGQILRQPRLARSLCIVAAQGPDAYYRGEIGREIVRAHQAVGGLLSEQDLAEHRSDWVEPMSVEYRGYTVYELPPNSQGIVALMILNMLQNLPAEPIRRGGADYVHLLAEAARRAHADREAYITDPQHMRVDPTTLLTPEYGQQQAAGIGARASGRVPAGTPGDTIYLCTADTDGNLVSLIESNYMGIGSGVMGGETGIMLQNRGAWFSLDPQDVNVIAPLKRTMHTLMPGMVFHGGKPYLVFGTMGGSQQAQIHAELLTRLLDQGLQLDEVLAAPRFDAVPERNGQEPIIEMEQGFTPEVIADLESRGHQVRPARGGQGHAHMIRILENGTYVGAADPRHDSLALGY